MKALSNKPSELIKLALADMEKVQRRGIKFDMTSWVDTDYQTNKICSVCMAGAVMTNTLDVKSLYDLDRETENKMRALNELRSGHFYRAFGFLKMRKPKSIPDVYDGYDDLQKFGDDLSDLSHSRNRREWRTHMATIIGILEAEGL